MTQYVDHPSAGVTHEEPPYAPLLVLQGWMISAPLARMTAYAVSTSSTSTLMPGATGAVLSLVMTLICAAGLDGDASVVIQPWFMTSSRPSRP